MFVSCNIYYCLFVLLEPFHCSECSISYMKYGSIKHELPLKHTDTQANNIDGTAFDLKKL